MVSGELRPERAKRIARAPVVSRPAGPSGDRPLLEDAWTSLTAARHAKFRPTRFWPATVLLGLASTGPGPAGTRCCHYPTVWTSEHPAGGGWLECRGEPKGLATPLVLHWELKGKGPSEYRWEAWHNDGMGLNAAQWTCAFGKAPNPLGGGSEATGSFRTDWGENLLLSIPSSGAIKKKAAGP